MFIKSLMMQKDQRKSKGMVYLSLAILTLAFCVIFVLRLGVFGSRIDWINQHSVFPEYFRQRFYETHDLLPDFAWNLGAGQNIYALSYYGLFSPVILLSYFLPMIPMDYYIMISSILSYVASVLLVYYWLKSHRYSTAFSGVMAIYFSLSTSLIYQFYNQIMFVNYMPFLCMAFIGTDRYLRSGKRRLLIGGILGMILTSFYFSISGMLALCLYALAEYLTQLDIARKAYLATQQADDAKSTNSSELVAAASHGMAVRGYKQGEAIGKAAFLMGVRYIGQILTAVFLAGILLVPTAVIIVGDDRTQNSSGQVTSAWMNFNPLKLLYSPYGVGMSLLAVVAVLAGILYAKKWTDRILPVSLFLVFTLPVVGVLLNGGLYEKTKVFIPFAPLLVLQTARYIKSSVQQKASFRLTLPWILVFLLVLWCGKGSSIEKYNLCILLELVGCGISFWVARQKKRPEIAVISSILCLLCIHMYLHPTYNRMLSGKEFAAQHNRQLKQQMEEIQEQDQDFYRMELYGDNSMNHNNINRLLNIEQNITSMYSSCYNQNYINFRKNIFHINEPLRNNMMQALTNNPCFLQFMGVKYSLVNQEEKGFTIEKREQAAPIWYVTDQVISQDEYQNYSFPECQTLLLQRSVVEAKEQENSGIKAGTNLSNLAKMIKQKVELPEQDGEGLSLHSIAEGSYEISAKKEVACSVPISVQDPGMDLLAISFRMINKHPRQDVSIRINQQINKISDYEYGNHNDVFYYMLPYEADQDLQIVFGRGEYEIEDLQVYTGCLAALQNHKLYQQPVQTDLHGPQGDCLSGRVSCAKSGYLITSIPYDENFDLFIDGKREELVRVNTSFLGAKLDEGEHVIRLEYHAAGKQAGLAMTLFGLLLFVGAEMLPSTIRKRK
ncbi:MAG: YfhO family protein [Lachnospiraceae bacterium]|nr:YfhO family protein [Lachnospiraceae bacterium]